MKRVDISWCLVIVLLANFNQLLTSSPTSSRASSPTIPAVPCNTPVGEDFWAGAGVPHLAAPDGNVCLSISDYAELCRNANQVGHFFSCEPGTPRTVLQRVGQIIESGVPTPTSSPDSDPTSFTTRKLPDTACLFSDDRTSRAPEPLVTSHTHGTTHYLAGAGAGAGASSPTSSQESVRSVASSVTWHGIPAAFSRPCVVGVGVSCLAAGIILGKILDKKK